MKKLICALTMISIYLNSPPSMSEQLPLGVVGNLLRDSNNNVITGKTWMEAKSLCEERGGRLPTIVELILEATKYGAKLEGARGKKLPGYRPVCEEPKRCYDYADGKTFYYDYKDFDPQKQEEDLIKYTIWSSSTHQDGECTKFVFQGSDGSLSGYFTVDDYNSIAIRCATGEGPVPERCF